jgi:hypothetical protein
MRDIYTKAIGGKVDPEVKAIFDRVYGKSDAQTDAFLKQLGTKEFPKVTPESVGVKSGMQDPHAGKTGVWKGPDADQPIKIEKTLGTKDGRTYVKVEGSNTGIPLDEITVDAPKPSSTRTRASKAEPTPVAPTAGEPKATGLANQVQDREAADSIIDQVATATGMKKGVAQAEGKAKVDSGLNVDDLADSVAKGTRPPSAVEFGALLEGKRRKLNRINALRDELTKNPGDVVTIRRLEEAQKDLGSYLQNIQKGKGKWSDVGRALQEGTTLDEANYAEVIQAVRGHNPKAATKYDAQIKQLTTDLADVQKQLADLRKSPPVEEQIKNVARESRKTATAATRDSIKAEREAAWNRLGARSNKISSGVDPQWLIDNTKDLATIMTSYVREGMVVLPDIVDRVNQELKRIGLPHRIDEEDARNVLGTTLATRRAPVTAYERDLINKERKARAAVRAIVEGTKPRTLVSRINSGIGELRLSDPAARLLDVASGIMGITGRILRDPITTPIARALGSNQRSIFSPGKFRGITEGAFQRQKAMVSEGGAGLDPDAILKYGKRPGKITRMVSLTDIPAKDFHMNDVFDDYAHGLSGGNKATYRAIMDQLRDGVDGPLTAEQVFEATNTAHEIAIRNTFMSDNVGSRALEGANMMASQLIRKQVPGPAGENLADAVTLVKDLFFRYSKVIGNVAQDRVESSGGGLVTGPFKLVAAKLNKAGLTEYEARDIADKISKGLYGIALVTLGGHLYREKVMRPDFVKTQQTQFVDWGDAEQLGGLFSPIALGASLAAIDDNIKDKKKNEEAKRKLIVDLMFNQPLTSGMTRLGDVTQGKEKAIGSILASATVPGIVAGTARRIDRYGPNRTSYRKTNTIKDAYMSRIPGEREKLPSGEKSRIRGNLP